MIVYLPAQQSAAHHAFHDVRRIFLFLASALHLVKPLQHGLRHAVLFALGGVAHGQAAELTHLLGDRAAAELLDDLGALEGVQAANGRRAFHRGQHIGG